KAARAKFEGIAAHAAIEPVSAWKLRFAKLKILQIQLLISLILQASSIVGWARGYRVLSAIM
ncbi:hypothetical protein P7D07_29515, partial [Bacillus cereus]|nr:hypothetical protein [Bacillus cereus]